MNARVAVPILAILAIPMITAAALLVVFDHTFVDANVSDSLGGVLVDAIWIVTGLIAWWRVPDNRIGALLTAFGFVEITGQLYWDAALPFTIASVASAFTFAIGVHLFSPSRADGCRAGANVRWSPSCTARR